MRYKVEASAVDHLQPRYSARRFGDPQAEVTGMEPTVRIAAPDDTYTLYKS